MEEDIDFIKYYMKQYFSEDIAIEDDFKFEKAIENLLKRYKELEEENKNARNEIIKIINTPEAIKNSINELRTNQFIGENVKLVILNYIDKIKTENEQYKKQFEDLKNNILVPGITEKNYITTSVIQKKIDELNGRIDYLNTELNKCYTEREKLGTETDIDNNETAIFCMEQEREYRNEQKQVLQELLEERNK